MFNATVTSGTASLTAEGIEAAKSTWGKVVDYGKGVSKNFSYFSLADQIREIIENPNLTDAQKAAEIFKLGHPVFSDNFGVRLLPNKNDEVAIIIDGAGNLVIVPQMWLADP